MKHNLLWTLVLFGSGACSGHHAGSEADSVKSHGLELEQTHGTSLLYLPESLCEVLPRFDAGGGVYDIVRMHSAVETTVEGGRAAFTYVDLKLINAWTKEAPARPTVRMRGGVEENGTSGGFTVSLKRGQQTGILLLGPTEYNRGYYAFDSRGVFQSEVEHGENRITNGLHVLDKTLAETGDRIGRILADRNECKTLDIKAHGVDAEMQHVEADEDPTDVRLELRDVD